MTHNQMEVHRRHAEPWRVTLVDTGNETYTGGRLKRVADYVKDEEAFCFTYGDGVGNVDITASIEFHKKHGRWVTMTAVERSGRYGVLQLDGSRLMSFEEKPHGDGLVNGGFFVLSPKCIDAVAHDMEMWEAEPMQRLVGMEQVMAFRHGGFWQPMDTLREKQELEKLWVSGKAPWKVWNEA
jgi:glucose-1-phosphate cytidylyltransferase